MWEAAKAGDDVAMLDRRLHAVLARDRRHERAAELLVGFVLAVAERHIEEEAGVGRERGGKEAGERLACDLERLGIGGEGPGRLAMDVPRELVAQQDQRQGPVG